MPRQIHSIQKNGSAVFPSRDVQSVLDTLHQPYLVLDAEHRVAAASTTFYFAFRLSTDEVLGAPLFSLGGGDWDIPALRILLEVLAGEREVVEGYEVEHTFRALGRRVLSLNVRTVREAGDRVRGFLLAISDVTEHRRARPADEAADGDELGARIVTDHQSDLVLLFGADGTLRYASDLSLSVLGYAPEELVRAGLEPLVHPDDAAEYRRFFRAALEGGVSEGLAYRVLAKGGGYVWLGSTARPVRDPDGEIAQVQMVGRDVTQRKRTEEALHWLSRQVKLILDSAGEGIFGLDLGGSITFANPAAARMLDHEERELVGRPHHAAFHDRRGDGEPVSVEQCAIHATLRDGLPRQVTDEVFRRRDGTLFPVDYTATPALEGERIVGAVVTFRDITARREAEASLRRAEWLAGIGQTTLAIRHEINNPLTSMLADAALLEMEGNSPEEEREMVRSIVRQARRIRDAVHRLAERKDAPTVKRVGDARMLDLSDPA